MKWSDPREFAELFGSQSSSRYRSHSLDKSTVVVLYVLYRTEVLYLDAHQGRQYERSLIAPTISF